MIAFSFEKDYNVYITSGDSTLEITFTHKAKKGLLRVPAKIRNSILQKLDLIAQNPRRTDLDIKKMSGVEAYRLRVGTYRAIYTEDGVILEVQNIAPRGEIYKR